MNQQLPHCHQFQKMENKFSSSELQSFLRTKYQSFVNSEYIRDFKSPAEVKVLSPMGAWDLLPFQMWVHWTPMSENPVRELAPLLYVGLSPLMASH